MSNRLWLAAKIGSVLFNSISTWNVFHTALKANGEFVALLGTVLAVFLVDILYLALMDLLEQPYADSEDISLRWSYAGGLILLYLCIVAIGVMDEGLIAIAPRIAMGIITLVIVTHFYGRWKSYKDEHWQNEYEKMRYRQEKKDQLKHSQKRRKVKNEQEEKALDSLKPELQKEYRIQLSKQLLTHLNAPEEVVEVPKIVYRQPLLEERAVKVIDQPAIPAGVTKLDETHWRWECSACGEGKVVATLWGAKIALSRHQNDHLRENKTLSG